MKEKKKSVEREKKGKKVYILSRSLTNYLTPSQPHDTTSAKQLACPYWGLEKGMAKYQNVLNSKVLIMLEYT